MDKLAGIYRRRHITVVEGKEFVVGGVLQLYKYTDIPI